MILPTRTDLLATLRLAVPVVAVELGLMLMGSVDAMFVGRVSANAVAAVSIGHAYFWVVFVFGLGILLALDPLISQAVGARDEPAIARAVQRGMVLAVVLTIICTFLLLPVDVVLRFLRQPPDVIPLAGRFVYASSGGLLPLFVLLVIRLVLQAHDRVAPLVIAIVAGNVVNLALNYVLVFGHFGAPAMGPFGSGLASTAGRWVMLFTLLAIIWRELKPRLVPWLPETLELKPIGRIIAIGIPIFIQYELEINAFAVVAVMMGWISATAMAGHQISINLAALTFMVPLGISMAGAVQVGRAVGAGDHALVRRAAGAALGIGVAFMSLTAILMLTVPRLLTRAYTADETIIAVAVMLLPLAGLFQVFDGIQVVSVGILRGTGDTRTPAIINVLGFWCLGVPTSWYLGMKTGMGPRGLWIGFVIGLAAVAILLLARVRTRLRQTLVRTYVDDTPARFLPDEG